MSEELTKLMDRFTTNDTDGFFRKGTRSSKLTGPVSDRADRATQDQVLDPRTRMILFKMINRGVFDEFRGCLSTGKEANVYRATAGDSQLAVKVYKTSILVFKDRDRYVTGEYRFRFGYSRSNPRKMVKLWAEKETRNLKRIWKSDIPVPKPLHLIDHVLVMEFLGDEYGWPSPRLKDANIDPDLYPMLYLQLLAYMRILFQECHLVHADLSEYNILWHQSRLYIIDVSQSVEHDHPASLEFMRMDIKNVNDYFSRQGVNTFSERRIFRFITTEVSTQPETVTDLMSRLQELPEEENTQESLVEDAVFRSVYIPRSLNDVFDAERDVEKVKQGANDELIYKDLLRPITSGEDGSFETSSESDTSEEDSDNEAIGDVWDQHWDTSSQTDRKFADRAANKERKKQVKQENQEKRAQKLKKKDKKKLISRSQAKSKTKH